MIKQAIWILLLIWFLLLLLYVLFYRGEPQFEILPAVEITDYEDRDWDEQRASRLNISLYTFHDRNRNGVYDLGDLPMASVAVHLTKPSGDSDQAKSNMNGYANFKMSYGNELHPITKTDSPYLFRVQAPAGWSISSGNGEQKITFRHLPGSVAGMVAETPPHWVGLVADLSLGFYAPQASEQISMDYRRFRLVSPTGEIQMLSLKPGGRVEYPASPGSWLLQGLGESDSVVYEREVLVGYAPVQVLLPSGGNSAIEPKLRRVVEDFDWLQRSIIEKIPNGHEGLDWDYLLAVHNQQYEGPGYVNGLISGHAVAYNSSGHPVTISSPTGKSFDFAGGYFSVAWPAAQGEVLDIRAYRGGEPVAQYELPLSYLGPVWLDADLRSIDRLLLTTRHYWQFVVDDLAFRFEEPGFR